LTGTRSGCRRTGVVVDDVVNRAVGDAHLRGLGGSDFEQIGKIVEFDPAAHPAELFRHRGGVLSDL
jgi:hypothetical protein